MHNLLVYTLGVASGFVLAIAWGMILEAKERKKLESKVNDVVNDIKKELVWANAREKYNKALAIVEQQNQLISQVEGPSKGPLFSKWRNDKRGQLLELEREKIDIFRSILADGLDPLVNVVSEGGEITKKKLSETVAEFDRQFPKEPDTPAKVSTPVKQPALKVVKFKDPNK